MRFRRRQIPREVTHTDQEWREALTPEAYKVLRARGTERPFTGRHVHPTDEPVVFACAGCGADLFDGATQFDSGTGWPSFDAPVDGAVEDRRDFSMGIPRTEVVCRRCGGHLGHVFRDGPASTGQRYCINDAALDARVKGFPLDG